MSRELFRLLRSCLFALAILSPGSGQAVPQAQPRIAPPTIPALQQPIHESSKGTLSDGTEIQMRLAARIKVKDVEVGDKVKFVLYHDLYYRDVLLAEAGQEIDATVAEAQKARWASRGSKLAIEMSGLKLLNGQVVPLRGYTSSMAGVGRVPGVADGVTKLASDLMCPICKNTNLFGPAAVPFFLAPGANKDLQENTSAPAYVDGNVSLDVASLRLIHRQKASDRGTIQVVRGHYRWPDRRDLYCNGVPLAHLDAGRKFSLVVEPGYYRFTINPKKDSVQIYVAPGTTTNLIATNDEISELLEKQINTNTRDVLVNPFSKPKSAGGLLEAAKPVNQADIYSTACVPLEVVFEGAP